MDERSSRAIRLFQDRYGALRRGALEELLRAFAGLPYENLSKIIAWNRGQGSASATSGDSLRDPLTVVAEHLALGTGGTCFSLTELLRCLLHAAGLAAEPVMAHMRHGSNIHCALQVELDGGLLLVDPGYLLEEPLPLDRGLPVDRGPGGEPLLVHAGALPGVPEDVPQGDFDLFTRDPDGQPRWRYRFGARPTPREEFLAHWRRSFTLPAMRSLLVTRRAGEELLYLHNHKLRRQGAGRVQTQNLRAELPGSLQQIFGIHPEVTCRALALVSAEREAWRRARGGGAGGGGSGRGGAGRGAG